MGRFIHTKGQTFDGRGSWNLFKWWFGISWGCGFVLVGAGMIGESTGIASVFLCLGAWLLWFVGLQVPAGAGMWKDRDDITLHPKLVAYAQQLDELEASMKVRDALSDLLAIERAKVQKRDNALRAIAEAGDLIEAKWTANRAISAAR